MDITITINTDNDAFFEQIDSEVSRILTKLALDIRENGIKDKILRDLNGNTIGNIKGKES